MYKTTNTIRKIIKLPFALFFLPFLAVVMFLAIDWENNYDRELYKKFIKDLIW